MSDIFCKPRATMFGGFSDSSVGKETTCNAGDPGSIPVSGRSAGEGIGYPVLHSWASLVVQLVKNQLAIQGELGSNPGLGRSPGEGKGYPLQYSGLENSIDCTVHGVTKSRTWLNDWNSPGQKTRVGSLSLLQGIFPTQESNPGLPHCRWILCQLSQKESPRILEWVAYPFFRGSSWPRNQTGVSCIVGRLFTNWAIREGRLHKWYCRT